MMKEIMVLCLLASPLRAQPEAALRGAFNELSLLARVAKLAALPYARRPVNAIPEICADLPVVAIKNNEIFKNGVSLGRNYSSYQANCDGLVAWTDSYGSLYRDAKKASDRVSQYEVAWYGDVIVWKDNSGELHKNGENYGRVYDFIFVKYTGDVVWKDSWGDVYRNREKFGRAQTYAAAARTGDVAWIDNFNDLHKNADKLGRAQQWQMADRTGDIGWLDSFRALYKNGVKVADGVNQFTMREDGKLIWIDSRGDTHSA